MKFINEEKIKNVKIKGDNYYVAIDFDKTITAKNSCDSWDATGKLLGQEFKDRLNKYYDIYSPIEQDYKISFEEKEKAMEIWYSKCMDMFYEFGLTESMLEESVKNSNIIFRDGAKELLYDLYKRNIPTIILSAGIGNTIEKILRNNECLYNNIKIISNFLSFDEKGNITKYKNDIIHTLNKTLEGHISDDINYKLQSKESRVLFGDFVEDKNIVPKSEWYKTVSVGFLNNKIEENTEVYKNSFDIVLTNEDASFNVARKIIKI